MSYFDPSGKTPCSENKTMGLPGHYDDDEITVNDLDTEKRLEAGKNNDVAPCVMLERCACGSLSCQARDLQLPSSTRTIYESWSITYRRPRRGTRSWLKLGNVVSTTPQTHFDQEELAAAVDRARSQYQPLTYVSPGYDGHLERRLRRLDWAVQDELCDLIRDRTQNTSNSFWRREYKLVVLVGVPGSEMTDAGSVLRTKIWSEWLGWPGSLLGCVGRGRDRMASSHVEYRVILRGTEVKSNDAGWGLYSRYSQPWKQADEAALTSVKGKCDGSHTLLD